MTQNWTEVSDEALIDRIRFMKSRNETGRPEYRLMVDDLLVRFLGQSAKDLAGTRVVKVPQGLEAFSLETLEAEVARRRAPKPDWKQIVAQSLQQGGRWTYAKLAQACKAAGCEEEVTPKMIGTWAAYASGFVSRDAEQFWLTDPPKTIEPSQPVSVKVGTYRPQYHGPAEWKPVLLEEMTDGKLWTIEHMRKVLEGKGFSITRSALSSGLHRLKVDGTLRNTDEGTYTMA